MASRLNLFAQLGLTFLPSLVLAAPCDIYKAGNTPCVAAHSPVRALYDSFDGFLYEVRRGSDNHTMPIKPLHAGGVANSTAQDDFCSGTTCVIVTIYDQSGHNNHLNQAPGGGAAQGPNPGGYDDLVLATGAPVTVNGSRAYGVFIQPDSGYRVDNTSGVATGDQPEGMYAIFDGTHYNSKCCFDYGNAETTNTDPGYPNGNGHMEAIYFGTGDGSGRGTGSGSGPWIMADLENGLFSGEDPVKNPADPTVTYRFLTAVIKGESNHWAIRGGDATSGQVTTYYDGPRPNATHYNPMSKEGAILLGVGGDNSDGAQGTFYEGVVTSGFPSNETEEQVAMNIKQANYQVTSITSGPPVNVGTSISFRVTTPYFNTRYLTHNGTLVYTQVVSNTSDSTLKAAASWNVKTGLGNSACVSFESKDQPGKYLRHVEDLNNEFGMSVDSDDGTKLMHEDATYCPQVGLNSPSNNLFRSWNFPTRAIRHYYNYCYIAQNGGPKTFDDPETYNDDASWFVGNSFV